MPKNNHVDIEEIIKTLERNTAEKETSAPANHSIYISHEKGEFPPLFPDLDRVGEKQVSTLRQVINSKTQKALDDAEDIAFAQEHLRRLKKG